MQETIKDLLKQLRHRYLNFVTNSNLGEEKIIEKYLGYVTNNDRNVVDIAASDGMTQSNTLFLYQQGWGGLALEYDPGRFAILANHYKRFPNVSLLRVKAIPTNVQSTLEAAQLPHNFCFLNLDIDSYDYYILDKILEKYRPQLICAEVNEKIPAGIEFSVKYNSSHYWYGDHFYGQSVSQLFKLCKKYRYKLVELYYNNAFLMPFEIKGPNAIDPITAYERGYKNKPDRKVKFPYNQDMEPLLTMDKAEAIRFIRNKFAKYKGDYICR